VIKTLASSLPTCSKILGPCDDTNGDKKYWRRTLGNKRVKIFAKYFYLLIQSLDHYSICIRYYNKIITSNVLLEKLKAEDGNSISSSSRVTI
jgi:hypothetical protein